MLEIRSDSSRQLSVFDPRARQLTISCGCALFNARVALAAAGFDAVVTRQPDPQDPRLLARVSIGAARDWIPIGALDRAIDDRRTNRREFIGEPVPARVVYELIAADLDHRRPTAPRRRAGRKRPLRRVSLSDARDDLPIRHFDVRGMGWLPSSNRSDAHECLLLFAGTSDQQTSWLQTGEALEHVWLERTRQGFAASPLNQVVETSSTCEQLRAALQTELHPAVLLRVEELVLSENRQLPDQLAKALGEQRSARVNRTRRAAQDMQHDES